MVTLAIASRQRQPGALFCKLKGQSAPDAAGGASEDYDILAKRLLRHQHAPDCVQSFCQNAHQL